MKTIDAIERLSSSELYLQVEQERLKNQLHYTLENSSFYKEKLGNLKIPTSELSRFLSDLPFTEKVELLNDQKNTPPYGKNLTIPQEQIQRVHRTSGTTGTPLYIFLNDGDIAMTVESGARCFRASGLGIGDTVIHCLNYCLWTGGYTDHQSLEATGATVIPYGSGNTQGLINTILHLRPTAIHCTPSYLAKIEKILSDDFGITPLDLKLKKGFFGGEGGWQKSRNFLEQKWGIRAMNANYGMADVLSMFGAECSTQSGMHFMGQGNIFPELIDPISLKIIPLEKSARGELVLTSLKKKAQPVIRFRTRDIIEIVDCDECQCGRSSFRFNVIGRSDDMLVFKGVNLFPSSVGEIIAEFEKNLTGEYQIVLNSPPPFDSFNLIVEYRKELVVSNREQFQHEVVEKLKTKLFVNPIIEFVPEGTLPRTGEKAKRVFRNYHV